MKVVIDYVKFKEVLNEYFNGNFVDSIISYMNDNDVFIQDTEDLIKEIKDEEEEAYADFDEYIKKYNIDLDVDDDWFSEGLKRAIDLIEKWRDKNE